MTDAREPTEDELIDFMDWLIDLEPSENIDMGKIAVIEEPLAYFSEDELGPASGEGVLVSSETADTDPNCRWWDDQLYVVDFGDIRLVYNLL